MNAVGDSVKITLFYDRDTTTYIDVTEFQEFENGTLKFKGKMHPSGPTGEWTIRPIYRSYVKN